MSEKLQRPELEAIFRPRSIAVVGASRKKGKIGTELVNNLFGCDFEGPIFPVNEREKFINSTKCYPSVAAIPDEVDLAVISVPKQFVRDVVRQCADKGIKGLIIITSGFKETGERGAEEESLLAEFIRDHGMIAIGPNCMGVINTDPDVRMNAAFGPMKVLPGRVSFLSQSGALGVVLIEQASEIGIGLRMFVSQGNRMDTSADEFLDYWHHDLGTDVILMYIESFGNPRSFPSAARRVAKDKPIVVLKSGRTSAGARAASSHTGALAGTDVAYDTLFHQCGVHRVGSIEELFDVAKAFANQPVPKGRRVAILTNGGGPAIMAADACSSLGLELTDFQPSTIEKLRANLPDEASIHNPVDMISSATPASYRFCMQTMLDDENVDSLLVIFVVPPMRDPVENLQVFADVARNRKDKTILVCLMGRIEQLKHTQVLQEARVPVYIFPESAARSLNALALRGEWLRKAQGEVRDFPVGRDRAQMVIAGALKRGGGYLYDNEVAEVLDAYGIPLAPSVRCTTQEAAVLATRELGLPVVMKVSSPRLIHKSDVGGVFIGLRSELEVRGAYDQIRDRALEHGVAPEEFGVLVQKQVDGGTETIIGMASDPSFGPLIMFGLGGTTVEILKDVVFRLCPLTNVDVEEMLSELRGLPLLTGYRGSEPVDIERVKEIIQRVSLLVSDFAQILELDINPMKVFPSGSDCVAVDARIRVG